MTDLRKEFGKRALKGLWVVIMGVEVITNYKDVNQMMRGHRKFIEELQDRLLTVGVALKTEIERNAQHQHEIAYLQNLANSDRQSKETINAGGRIQGGGKSSKPVIQAAIRQKIPFRKQISQVCSYASDHPVAQVRKKSKRQLDREAKNPMKSAEELTQYLKKSKTLKEATVALGKLVADEDLGLYIPVLLRQMAAALFFEFMDETIKWQSPLKTEVCFGTNPAKTEFNNPIMDRSHPTKLWRRGLVDECPFYPVPTTPSFIPDLIIPEYRKKPLTLDNIFVLVEIKFENDKFNAKQIKRYGRLRDKSQKEKDRKKLHTGLLAVTTKFSVMRVPEDLSPKIKENYYKKQKKRDEKIAKAKQEKSNKLILPFQFGK